VDILVEVQFGPFRCVCLTVSKTVSLTGEMETHFVFCAVRNEPSNRQILLENFSSLTDKVAREAVNVGPCTDGS
jgi:hypothetical protein